MKKGSITKFKLDPKKPPKSHWRAFDTMIEEERHQAGAFRIRTLRQPPKRSLRALVVCRPWVRCARS